MIKKKEADKRKGKWDENAINQSFEELLDSIGEILDKVTLSGCRPLFLRTPFLRYYLEILELLESELLLQWKIKREKGLQALFVRQQQWMSLQLRIPDGFFSKWNLFCGEVWRASGDESVMLNRNPWKSLLFQTMTDLDSLIEIRGEIQGNSRAPILSQVCDLFELLYKTRHHQVINFLNLNEIGSKQRPEIQAIGEIERCLPSPPVPAIIQKTFAAQINNEKWEQTPEKLLEFWKSNSGGIFSLFPACSLKRKSNGKYALVGVQPENWIYFEDLIGIEKNRDRLISNTARFLSGKYAHNVLLWGGRGTGKTSSVLALLAYFVERGLRVIEVQQDDLDLIPELSIQIKKRPEKFILFCDDLSFEKHSTNYKYLKSIMEGSLLALAGNPLFIATANRKDLVFRGELDELNPEHKQLIDEKRAIDDRFGLKLFYDIPVFKNLHKILFHYADKTGHPYKKEELVNRFSNFALKNNHDNPAGRTIRQFIKEWEQNQKKS